MAISLFSWGILELLDILDFLELLDILDILDFLDYLEALPYQMRTSCMSKVSME